MYEGISGVSFLNGPNEAFGTKFEVVDMKKVHQNLIFRAEAAGYLFTIQSQGNYTQIKVSENGRSRLSIKNPNVTVKQAEIRENVRSSVKCLPAASVIASPHVP